MLRMLNNKNLKMSRFLILKSRLFPFQCVEDHRRPLQNLWVSIGKLCTLRFCPFVLAGELRHNRSDLCQVLEWQNLRGVFKRVY